MTTKSPPSRSAAAGPSCASSPPTQPAAAPPDAAPPATQPAAAPPDARAARTTYRSVFAVGEFRVLFAALLMYVLGFEFEILGLSVLIFDQTRFRLLDRAGVRHGIRASGHRRRAVHLAG